MTLPTTNGANYFLFPSPMAPMTLEIVSITNANPMVVVTSTNNQWVVGQLAYFTIPFSFGMQQLNQKTVQIIGIDTTNRVLTFALNSTGYDPFSIPMGSQQVAMMASQGSRNTYNFTTLPYHAINANIGN